MSKTMTNARTTNLLVFEFNLDTETKEDWLQITAVNNIGVIGREINQKIIRLNPEKQRELYEMLKEKFEEQRII